MPPFKPNLAIQIKQDWCCASTTPTPQELAGHPELYEIARDPKALPPFMRSLQFQQNGNTLMFDLSLTVEELHRAIDPIEQAMDNTFVLAFALLSLANFVPRPKC